MRFRVDGSLREVVQPNRALHAALISRLKIMADLDISEKRLPQDGRISLRLGSRAIDVRVSTLPSAHGERAVLRLLDKSESKLTLAAVGMEGQTLERFNQLAAQPHGIAQCGHKGRRLLARLGGGEFRGRVGRDVAAAGAGVQQLEPGHVARVEGGRVTQRRRYWELDLSDERVDRSLTFASAMEQVDAVLNDALSLRLRADVPVAAYLSGGLDSSLLCALAQQKLGGTLQTFSVAFEQARFDERTFQQEVAQALGTEHHVTQVGDADIGALLPKVVWHAEQVLLRSAPAPFFALSRLVREHGTKVVLTGEGADEVFLGYDLFKETAVRRFASP